MSQPLFVGSLSWVEHKTTERLCKRPPNVDVCQRTISAPESFAKGPWETRML